MTVTHADYRLSQLDQLEAESIHIFREVAAEFEKPVLMFSGGKDSIVMMRLAEKASFRPRSPSRWGPSRSRDHLNEPTHRLVHLMDAVIGVVVAARMTDGPSTVPDSLPPLPGVHQPAGCLGIRREGHTAEGRVSSGRRKVRGGRAYDSIECGRVHNPYELVGGRGGE
jgi:hypothetical protein